MPAATTGTDLSTAIVATRAAVDMSLGVTAEGASAVPLALLLGQTAGAHSTETALVVTGTSIEITTVVIRTETAVAMAVIGTRWAGPLIAAAAPSPSCSQRRAEPVLDSSCRGDQQLRP